jgi:hypothetical protein
MGFFIKIIEEVLGYMRSFLYVCYVMRETLNPLNMEIGLTVKVNHIRLEGKELIIKKFYKYSAQLQLVGGRTTYNVPLHLIVL